jgi:hypothetical protein
MMESVVVGRESDMQGVLLGGLRIVRHVLVQIVIARH